ncbi:unnamed protein product [Rotaria sp. Silwood2]|nr:unnamed protein product [Rotaria sp. Silwood2]
MAPPPMDSDIFDVVLLMRPYRDTSDKPHPYSSRQSILSDLYVNPNALGLGIAGLLLKQAYEEQARQRTNIHSIIWETEVYNCSAQKTYRILMWIMN